MTNNTITSTRKTLIKDADHLKQDAGQIVEDVKKHATAHVDAVRGQLSDTFDLARGYVKAHPLKLVAGAFLFGFIIGTFRRR